jgi:hypothetical protein
MGLPQAYVPKGAGNVLGRFLFFSSGGCGCDAPCFLWKAFYEGKQAQGCAHGKTAKSWAGVRRSKAGRIDFYVVVT